MRNCTKIIVLLALLNHTIQVFASADAEIKEYINQYELFRQALLANKFGEAEEQLKTAEKIYKRMPQEIKDQLYAAIPEDTISQRVGLKPSESRFFYLASKLIKELESKKQKPLPAKIAAKPKPTPPEFLLPTRQAKLAAIQLSPAEQKKLKEIQDEVAEDKRSSIFSTSSVLQKVIATENLRILEWLLASPEGRKQCDMHRKKGSFYEQTSYPSDFYYALQAGYKPVIDLFLTYGANVNFVGADGNAYLHTAILEQDPAVVKELIRAHADINKKNSAGLTPLCLAAAVENNEIAKMLIQAGGQCNSNEFYDFLIKSGYKSAEQKVFFDTMQQDEPTEDEVADFERQALNQQESNLMFAINTNNLPMVHYFIKHEPDTVNMPNKDGQTPLLAAIESYRNAAAAILINSPVIDLHKIATSGMPEFHHDRAKNILVPFYPQLIPLMAATRAHNIPLMRLLLTHKVDVNQQDSEGNTAAHYANIPQLTLLQQYGTDFSIYNNDGATPLHKLILTRRLKNDERSIEFIKNNLALFNTQLTKPYGTTPLEVAAHYNPEVLKPLIAAGIKLAALPNRMILYYAASSNNNALQILLQEPAVKKLVNVKDANGNTPLCIALSHMRKYPDAKYYKTNGIALRLAGGQCDISRYKETIDLIDKEIAQAKEEARVAAEVIPVNLPSDIHHIIAGYTGTPKPRKEKREQEIKTKSSQKEQIKVKK
jgi:ankyrin repeat protein